MKNILLTLSILLLCTQTHAQRNDYELLYLQGDISTLKELSQGLQDVEDYFWQAQIKNINGNNMQALEILENGIEKYPENDKLEEIYINTLYKTRQYAKLKPILSERLDEPASFIKYISILEFNEDWNAAISLLEEKVIIDSMNTEYLVHLGDNYLKSERLLSAIDVYRKIFEINPNDLETCYKLAKSLTKISGVSEQYEAIEVCDHALDLEPISLKFLKTRGIILFNMREYKEAFINFNQLYHLGDTSQFALKHLGICEFETRKFKEARKHLINAFSKDSSDFEVSFMLGRAYINSPEPEKGLFYLDHADSLLQPNPKLLAALFYDKQSIYSILEMHDEALYCYLEAYKLDPKPEYLFFIASKYENAFADKRKALEYYEKFIEALPEKEVSQHEVTNSQAKISMRKIAEDKITTLKEDLFFEGGM